jgi:hypothetical protein
MEWPTCMECGNGHMLPLSGPNSYRSMADHFIEPINVWVCSNPECHFKVDKESKPKEASKKS